MRPRTAACGSTTTTPDAVRLRRVRNAGRRLRRGVPVTSSSAVRLLAGGIGSSSCSSSSSSRRPVLVSLGLPAEGRADDPPPRRPVAEPRPTELVVALGLGDPVFQAGAVRDGEVDPRARSRGRDRPQSGQAPRHPAGSFRLRQPASRLLVGDDAALGPDDRIDPAGPGRVGHRRSQRPVSRHRPGGRAATRAAAAGDARRSRRSARVPCAGATAPGDRGVVAPTARPHPAPTSERSARARPDRRVRRGPRRRRRGRAARRRPGRRCSGRSRRGSSAGGGYVVAVTRGGPVAVAEVDRALARMRADGTMHRLARHVARDRPGPPRAAALSASLLGGSAGRRAAERSTGT